MTLGEKIRYLREVEGSLRELGRPMTQQEIVRAVKQEQGKSISQSYLSQIERGSRRHMTQSSRTLLARFFKVHPGFLVDDPEGYHTELVSDLRTTEGKLDVWLLQGWGRFSMRPVLPNGCSKRLIPMPRATIAAEAVRARKGGGSNDVGRFLLDLFCARFRLQRAFVFGRRIALALPSAPRSAWRRSCADPRRSPRSGRRPWAGCWPCASNRRVRRSREPDDFAV